MKESELQALQCRFTPLIRYIIAPILPDQRDREECINDIFLKIWNNFHTFDPEKGTLTAWLSALARNTAIDHARRIPPAEGELDEKLSGPESDPEQALLRREWQEALKNALGRLSPGDQALFYRKYYYRQPTAQIAAELGTTQRAIEGRLYRVKRKLRRELGGDWYD